MKRRSRGGGELRGDGSGRLWLIHWRLIHCYGNEQHRPLQLLVSGGGMEGWKCCGSHMQPMVWSLIKDWQQIWSKLFHFSCWGQKVRHSGFTTSLRKQRGRKNYFWYFLSSVSPLLEEVLLSSTAGFRFITITNQHYHCWLGSESIGGSSTSSVPDLKEKIWWSEKRCLCWTLAKLLFFLTL